MSSARVDILLVRFEMICQFFNTARQNPDLHFRRPCIFLVHPYFFYNILLFSPGYHSKEEYSIKLFILQLYVRVGTQSTKNTSSLQCNYVLYSKGHFIKDIRKCPL